MVLMNGAPAQAIWGLFKKPEKLPTEESIVNVGPRKEASASPLPILRLPAAVLGTGAGVYLVRVLEVQKNVKELRLFRQDRLAAACPVNFVRPHPPSPVKGPIATKTTIEWVTAKTFKLIYQDNTGIYESNPLPVNP